MPDGYKLIGAFNGMGDKIPLKKDDHGNYYVVVPKAGGVYLSAEFKKDADDDEDEDDEDEDDEDEDDEDEDDDEDAEGEDGPDVTETVRVTEESEEELNINSIKVDDNPAVGIEIIAARDVDVDEDITVTGGDQGATGIKASADGKSVTSEVETGSGMKACRIRGCSIRACHCYMADVTCIRLPYSSGKV